RLFDRDAFIRHLLFVEAAEASIRGEPGVRRDPRAGDEEDAARRREPFSQSFHRPSHSPTYNRAVTNRILYAPSPEAVARTYMETFRARFADRVGTPIADSRALHRASIDHVAEFWDAIWDELGVVGEKGERVLESPEAMPGARFFPDAALNFAENLLRKRDDSLALVFATEGGTERKLT